MLLYQLLSQKVKHHPHQIAVGSIKNGSLRHLNYLDFKERIFLSISYLKSKGIQEGDFVFLLGNTGLDWHIFDLAIMMMGAICVPLYPSFGKKDLLDITSHFDDYSVVATDIDNFELFNEHISTFKSVIHSPELDWGDSLTSEEHDLIENQILKIQDDSIATIIFTSGTTGEPKGAIFDQRSFYEVLDSIYNFLGKRIKNGSRSFCSLPLAHVLGRCDSLLHLKLNVSTFFGESLETFQKDLKAAKPNYLITVPRVLEKIEERILAIVANTSSLHQRLFKINIEISNNFYSKVERGNKPSILERNLFLSSQKYFFKQIKKQISPNIDFMVTGGAPLKNATFNFFRSIGIPILEGYGLTETLGPVTLNPLEYQSRGSVGQALPGVQINICPDGEIEIRCPYMFKGYFDEPKNTLSAKNFLKTGDIGDIDSSGFLKITDRKKNIIITSGGKNIAPQKIENLLAHSPYIDYALVTGDGEKFLGAIISFNRDNILNFLGERLDLANYSYESLSKSPEVYVLLEQTIKEINQDLANFERIKKFVILPIELKDDTNFLTPSLKVKRSALLNKFQKHIDSMHNDS